MAQAVGGSWCDVELTVTTEKGAISNAVRAYRGTFPPHTDNYWNRLEGAILSNSPSLSSLPGLPPFFSGHPPDLQEVYPSKPPVYPGNARATYCFEGSVDLIVVAPGCRFLELDDFKFTPASKQIIHLDFFNPVSAYHRFEPIPFWEGDWLRENALQIDRGASHPMASFTDASALDVFNRFRELLNANDLKTGVIFTAPSGAYFGDRLHPDETLDVRFGTELRDVNLKGGEQVRGRAWNVRFGGGDGVDRFNRRGDGEVAIFLDDNAGLGLFHIKPTASYIAKIIFHEVGHAFGLVHIEPEPGNPDQVMDYENENNASLEYLYDKPTGFWWDHSGIAPGNFFPELDHNPRYHWKKYVELDPSPKALDGLPLVPGVYDDMDVLILENSNLGLIESPMFSALDLSANIPAYQVTVYFPSPSGSSGGPGSLGELLGDTREDGSFSEKALLEIDGFSPFYLVGRSNPVGPFDLVFGFGSADNPQLDWNLGMNSDLPCNVYQVDTDAGTARTVGSFTVQRVSGSLVIADPVERIGIAPLIDTGPGSIDFPSATFANTTSFDGNGLFIASKVSISEPSIIDEVEFWMIPPIGRLTSRVYSDHNGKPGIMLSESTETASGFNVFEADWFSFGNLNWAIPAGDYWLSIEPEDWTGTGYLPIDAPDPLTTYAYKTPGERDWTEWENASFGVRVNGLEIVPPANLQITEFSISPALELQISWISEEGSRYQIEANEELENQGDWKKVGPIVFGKPDRSSLNLSLAEEPSKLFLRVRKLP